MRTTTEYHPPYLTTTSEATRRRLALAMGTRSGRQNRRRDRSPEIIVAAVCGAVMGAVCGACLAFAAISDAILP